MLPIIYQESQKFGLMTQSQFDNLVALSQVTPGPIAVNAATYVGYNTGGFLGAIVATLGVILPSFIIVSIVYYFVMKFRESQIVIYGFSGIKPVTAGLMISAIVFVSKDMFLSFDIFSLVIFSLTFLLMYFKKMGSIGIILISGLSAMLLKFIGFNI